MARPLSQHPLRSAFIGGALGLGACADARPPKADPTCADYHAAFEACMRELGLEHSPGGGAARACEADDLTARERAYFRCLTEVLDQTQCEVDAVPFVREALDDCRDTHLAEPG